MFDSIKAGRILKVTRRNWKSRELQQEVVLPLLVVMHEGFSWLLFCLKYLAFTDDLKTVDMELNNFELIPYK